MSLYWYGINIDNVMLCSACVEENQITIDVGIKALNFLILLVLLEKEIKCVIWLPIKHFVFESVYEVHTNAGRYMGRGIIAFYHQIQIDMQIRIYVFKVIITEICI